jgi:glycosyltransferase involved in cell wall biosynthesis
MMLRIFWLGMHKVLVQTELTRLRKLGFEVFNPPYLSNIKDQSAEQDWSLESQNSSLPTSVLQKLSTYNFFYNPISSEIAKILNRYFDAVIVTINPSWLLEVCKVYNGKIIYRTYGTPYCISEELTNIGADLKILERNNFWYIPHAQETLQYEHKWLQGRAKIIPYCITNDVIQKENTWKHGIPKKPEIAISCPNIDNEYYRNHYKFLKKEFWSPHFRFYGVQLSKVNDSQVVGSLSRNDQLEGLRNSSGYLYTYDEPCVCYLPPIEMATMGGPVLFLRGSLLDQFFPENAVSRCFSIQDAHDKCRRLIHGDVAFRNQVIKEGRTAVRRYHPKVVWPVFDRKIKEALFQNNTRVPWLSSYSEIRKQTNTQKKTIYIFNHFPGRIIHFKGGEYSSGEGIMKVMRQMVYAICSQNKKLNLYITCGEKDIAFAHGYFLKSIHQGHVRILPLISRDRKFTHFRAGWKRLWENIFSLIPQKPFSKINSVRKQIKNYALPKIVSWKKPLPLNSENSGALIKEINSDPACLAAFIPHYYLFPEAVSLRKKLLLYLPDYLPWLFPRNKEFIEIRSSFEKTAKSISKKASAVLTNSNFTKNYLPNCSLKIEKKKIHVIPLPLLISPQTRISGDAALRLPEKFIFYPTQQRPNKQIGDLIKVFSILSKSYKDLFLVLTSDPAENMDCFKDYEKCANRKNIVILPKMSDSELTMTYRKAMVLAFTSSAEGNFPPQIYEAISFDTPVVAFRHEFICEAIPPELESCLTLAEPGNVQDFVDKVKWVIKNPESVIKQQKRLLKVLGKANSLASLSSSLGKVIKILEGSEL